jgi:FAD/FMN-containing dehydrogenase
VLKLAQDMGGSMEYVHGAGVRLAHLMAREHGAGFDVLRSVKLTLDPHGLLNPGKLGL